MAELNGRAEWQNRNGRAEWEEPNGRAEMAEPNGRAEWQTEQQSNVKYSGRSRDRLFWQTYDRSRTAEWQTGKPRNKPKRPRNKM